MKPLFIPAALVRQIIAFVFLGLSFGMAAPTASAQSIDPFENGWTLNPEDSRLQFLSIKTGNVAETNAFATLSGLISEDGKAQIRVLLDSVDTKIDLRNVRMRFLFFETFLHPEAIITAQLDPALLLDLHNVRRKLINLDFTLTLHGVTVTRTAEVAIALINNDRVTVSATTPIALTVAEFGLEAGRQKLEAAANVVITPLGIVSFDFVFDRASPGTPPDLALVTAAVAPGSAALESGGVLEREACVGRLEILSRTGNIHFGSGSARLARKSWPVLDSLYDIVSRCPGMAIKIAGHTDSSGAASYNQMLSEKRAGAVAKYLQSKGIAAERMTVVGYGEAKPLHPNTSWANKTKNRRIEFSVLN